MDAQGYVERLGLAMKDEDDCSIKLCLKGIMDEGIDLNTVISLLRLFADDPDCSDHMFGLVHTLEQAIPRVVYDGVVSEIEAMRERAPGWAEIIVGRLLAARSDQGHDYDCYEFLEAASKKADSGAKRSIVAIARNLFGKGKVALEMMDRIKVLL